MMNPSPSQVDSFLLDDDAVIGADDDDVEASDEAEDEDEEDEDSRVGEVDGESSGSSLESG